ncbi:MAG: membrane protein insertase YidC [Byssovorax sp.]
MDRSSITKWLLLGLALFLFWQYGRKAIGLAPATNEHQPIVLLADATAPAERSPEEMCRIETGNFAADLSTRGASLRHFVLKNGNYYQTNDKDPYDRTGKMDLVTTPTSEARMPLRTDLRSPAAAVPQQQTPFDDVDWKLATHDGTSCTFTHVDDTTSLTKIVRFTGKPYELEVDLKVQNLATEPKKHRLTFEQTGYIKKKDIEGGFMRRQSEHATETMASAGEKTEKQGPSDFDPDNFKKKEFTTEGWRRTPGDARFIAVNTSYFSKLAIPLERPAGLAAPAAETRIEDIWNPIFVERAKDPELGHIYRARLAYPEKELKQGETAEYKVLTFNGPKERDLLKAVDPIATDVLNLGMFAIIGKLLVTYLTWLFHLTGSWGVAIILMTITVKTALFPLSLTQIKSSIAMRKLKPEMDALNEKYKDDATQRGLATQELWKKNGITNPVLGCLPMLLQMPVWWALYSALQTAIELYHVPFGPFIPDLSAPGKYFIIPIVLGASSFIQQRMMPAQGDAQQQKMMMYMMPAVFTFMMLFLPAGLGVYMMTNTWLGIAQQFLVEKYQKAKASSPGTIEVREKTEGGGGKPTATLGKGKARVRG